MTETTKQTRTITDAEMAQQRAYTEQIAAWNRLYTEEHGSPRRCYVQTFGCQQNEADSVWRRQWGMRRLYLRTMPL